MTRKKVPAPMELDAELLRFRDQLDAETDRGVALIGAALLDDLLADLIRVGFLDEPDCVEVFLRNAGPLGTFSARTELAYRARWIGPDPHHDLVLVRGIRNDFAHVRERLAFRDQRIAALCPNARYLARVEARGGGAANPGATATPRTRITLTVIVLGSVLGVAKKTLKRPSGGLSYAPFHLRVDFPPSEGEKG